jgi:AraC-like DNA-binding protein
MFVHCSRIQRQFEYLEKLGIDITPLYKQTGIPKDCKFEPELNFDFEQYKTVLDFALRQTNNPDYGLDFGTQPYLGGTVGMMGASSKNLKESFIQGCNYFKVLGDFVDISFIDDENSPKLVYTPIRSWVIENPHTAKVEVDIMFSFLNTILKINSNGVLKPQKINFACKKPESTEKYIEIFGVKPFFETEYNEMIFENASMMMPMKAFNPETFHLLNQYLESRLSQLSNSEKLSDKVKKILHSSFKYEFPDIESVATKLQITARTLQRKLSIEQTTYKEILQETRFGIAKQLLKQNQLTVSEIGFMLGYSDIGNFSRSFKKYVGESPVEFKEK